jgi:tight adherence protein B
VVMTILSLACGAGVGIGIIVLLRVCGPGVAPLGSATRSWDGKSGASLRRNQRPSWIPKLVLGVVSAAVVGILTRWPAAIVIAAAGGAGLPSVLDVTGRSTATARTEAIAVWTELLRDTLAAASGLSQAIVATASVAPEAIRAEVGMLASRLSNGMPIPEATRIFADEVADPSCDLVACALILAATARAQRLVDLLGALADSMREEVAMRLRIEAGRASARSGVRTIVLFSLGFATLLALVARSYLQPFGSSSGEVMLLLSGAFDAAGIVLMVRFVRDVAPQRLLRAHTGNVESLR